jgi:hypothetical protein
VDLTWRIIILKLIAYVNQWRQTISGIACVLNLDWAIRWWQQRLILSGLRLAAQNCVADKAWETRT